MTADDEPPPGWAPLAELEPFRSHVTVTLGDGRVLRFDSDDPKARPKLFGAVQTKKSYVSYHLMPVCEDPALLNGIDDATQENARQVVLQLHGRRADAVQRA